VTTSAAQAPLRSGLLAHRRLLWTVSTATFLVFFQAFMVAPLIPRLAEDLGASPQRVGLAIPAYMLPYGAATLVYGLLSDRVGRRPLMLGSLAALVVLAAATATAQSADQLLAWRLATGLGASAVVPLSLTLVGALFPFEQRGRRLGWLFAAMAGAPTATCSRTRSSTPVCTRGWACTSRSATASTRSPSPSRFSATESPASCSARASAGRPTASGVGGCCRSASPSERSARSGSCR
jgi:hypothetical protein